MRNPKIRRLVVTGMLAGICIVLGMTPLGFIPIPGFNLTTMHLPVILGALIEGPIVGAVLGLIFGLLSMYRALVAPGVLSPLFLNPVVAILPRLLIGPMTYLVYSGLKRLLKGRNWLPAAGAAFAGSIFNTIGVLGIVNLFFIQAYADLMSMPVGLVTGAIWLAVLTNGVPEALAAAIIISPTERALRHIVGGRGGAARRGRASLGEPAHRAQASQSAKEKEEKHDPDV